MPTPTPEQQAVIESMAEGKAALVNAVAGSGKTTTLVNGLREIKVETLALAFNKSIQTTLEKQLASNPKVLAKTLNGLGHGAWQSQIGKKVTLNRDKLAQITGEVTDRLQFPEHWGTILNYARKCKTIGMLPEGTPTGMSLVPDHPDTYEDIEFNFGMDNITAHPKLIEAVREVLRKSNALGFQGEIDFDDQLYMTTCFKARMRQFENVVVDEAQDLSPIQHIMLKRSVAGALTAVGDPHQSIYGFRGAMSGSMGALQEEFNLPELPLTYCFRCSQAVIERAQEIVPYIKWAPNAPQGLVESRWPEDRSQGMTDWSHSDFNYGDAVLCRNVAPLVDMAFKLIQQGVSVKMAGRDIGKNLSNMVKKICPNKDTSLDIKDFVVRLESWRDVEKASANAKKQDWKIEQINDRADTLNIMIEANNCRTAEDLCLAIEHLFNNQNGAVLLSTIHRAKGLEWPRVWFLDSWRLPSYHAQKSDNPEMMTQEMNLQYVAITRAERELIYIDLPRRK